MATSASFTPPLILRNLFIPGGFDGLEWEPFYAGVEIHRLHREEGGSSSALLRYAPGASLARHIHCGYEHILILLGSQIDDSGEHFEGTLLVHPPGTSHRITSPEGCVVLAVWQKEVVIEPIQRRRSRGSDNRRQRGDERP